MHSGLCFCCCFHKAGRGCICLKRDTGRRLKAAPAVGLVSHLLGEAGPEQGNWSVTGAGVKVPRGEQDAREATRRAG